jgi:hypothetical protein
MSTSKLNFIAIVAIVAAFAGSTIVIGSVFAQNNMSNSSSTGNASSTSSGGNTNSTNTGNITDSGKPMSNGGNL